MGLTLVLFLLAVTVWVTSWQTRMTPLEAVLFVCASLIPCVRSVHWLITRVRPAESGTARMRGRAPDGTTRWLGVLRAELRERDRTLGGLFGFFLTIVFGFLVIPDQPLQAEPIICCALFGGVCGCRDWRFVGLTGGAVVGLLVVTAGLKVETLAPWVSLDSRWWFAACFVPIGGLFAGYLSDGRLQSRTGAELASAATSGEGLRLPESAGPH